MRKIRIIVVDDHKQTLDMMERWLSRDGNEVIPFNEPMRCPLNAEDTNECFKETKCADIYLTDFEMPKINGLELLKRQAEIGCKLDIRNKAVISGSMDDELKSKVRKMGYRFFDKPIDLSEVKAWLKECEKRLDLSEQLSRVDG